MPHHRAAQVLEHRHARKDVGDLEAAAEAATVDLVGLQPGDVLAVQRDAAGRDREAAGDEVEQRRSEEHTSELQSLMRISYAVFCLKKKKQIEKSKINRQPITENK